MPASHARLEKGSRARGLFRVAIAVAVCLGWYAPYTGSATFTVSTLDNDASPGSLRDAVAHAQASPGADEIVFQNGLTGTIDGGAQINVSEDLTITGPGSDRITINNTETRSLILVDSVAVDLTLSGMTLNRTVDGRLIEHSGVNGVGTLTVRDSDLLSTQSDDGREDGGAIWASDDQLVIENVLFKDFNLQANGGAIRSSGNATITRSTFQDNRTYRTSGRVWGGAIFLAGKTGTTQTVLIDRCRFTNNESLVGGAIAVESFDDMGSVQDLIVLNSTFATNSGIDYGGAIYAYTDAAADDPNAVNITLEGSTFHANVTGVAGGAVSVIAAGGTIVLNVVNATFSGNSAETRFRSGTKNGGALFLSGASGTMVDARFLHATISGNQARLGEDDGSGGGIYIVNPATVSVTLTNSIVAMNTDDVSGDGNDDIAGIAIADFSLLGDTPGDVNPANVTEPTPGSNIFNADPELGALADNGGPTLTHAVLPGSPVVGAADESASGSLLPLPEYEQRGTGYPRIRDGALEMGAVELGEGKISADGKDGSGNAFALSWWYVTVLAGGAWFAQRRRVPVKIASCGQR